MKHPKTAALILAVSMMPGLAFAQEGPVTFEFSFSNPGARAMGFGGAFVALADDATAAFANPAGLVQLIEPEISVEGRHWSYDAQFVAGGRVSGEPTGFGLDTTADIRHGFSTDDVTGLSFASAVLPGKGWSVAVYRHLWADFSLSRRIDGLFFAEDGETGRSEDVVARTDLSVVNIGLAGALRLSPTVSIGVGAVHFDAVLDAYSEEHRVLDDQMFYQSNPFTPDGLDTSYSNTGRDSGVILHGGLLWKPNERWSIGATYREGPEIRLSVIEITGSANDDLPPGTVEVDSTSPLKFPDVYGLGAAYRTASGALTVSFEWNRVLYSDLTNSLDATVFDTGQVKLGDVDEYHLGLELVLARSTPLIALRGGAWFDPAHGLGPGPDADPVEAAIFNGGEDQVHLTGGLGMAFRTFQLDLGFDLSDSVDSYSLSLVYRF